MKPKSSNPFVLRHSSEGRWIREEDGLHGTVAQVVSTDDVWFPPMGLQVVHGKNVIDKPWPYVPPLPAVLVRSRSAVEFPAVRTTREHRSDLARYLFDPRGFFLLVRRKGLNGDPHPSTAVTVGAPATQRVESRGGSSSEARHSVDGC